MAPDTGDGAGQMEATTSAPFADEDTEAQMIQSRDSSTAMSADSGAPSPQSSPFGFMPCVVMVLASPYCIYYVCIFKPVFFPC